MTSTSTTEAKATKTAPLEDLMVAMDVVDTLRHRQGMVEQELNSDARRERLIAKLRDIYKAQGIAVTDDMLAEGVKALEEDRFRYTPPKPSLSTKLANMYINRKNWGRRFLPFFMFAAFAGTAFYVQEYRPAQQFKAEIPNKLQQTFGRIAAVSKTDEATDRAQILLDNARAEIKQGDYASAKTHYNKMQMLLRKLESTYELRIVSRPNELSGVFRIPNVNSNARNYYLIVEAVDTDGRVLTMPVVNEETGRSVSVTKFGLRVDENTFRRVGADKNDDGIIQNNVVGSKDQGELQPRYIIKTTGDTITRW